MGALGLDIARALIAARLLLTVTTTPPSTNSPRAWFRDEKARFAETQAHSAFPISCPHLRAGLKLLPLRTAVEYLPQFKVPLLRAAPRIVQHLQVQ